MRKKKMEPALTGDCGDPMLADAADLRGLCWMKLDMCRLQGSDFMHLANNEEFGAALKLWVAAMRQVPAGSLPNNDRIIASLAGYANAPKGWSKVKDMALYGWVPCNDDRLYHPVICDMVLEIQNGKHSAQGFSKTATETSEEKRRRQNRERVKRWRQAKASETHDGGLSESKVSLSEASVGVDAEVQRHGHVTQCVTTGVTQKSVTESITVMGSNITGNGYSIEKEEEKNKSNGNTHTSVTPNGVTESNTDHAVTHYAEPPVMHYSQEHTHRAPTIIPAKQACLTDQEWDGYFSDSQHHDVTPSNNAMDDETLGTSHHHADRMTFVLSPECDAAVLADSAEGTLTLAMEEPLEELPSDNMVSDPFSDLGDSLDALVSDPDLSGPLSASDSLQGDGVFDGSHDQSCDHSYVADGSCGHEENNTDAVLTSGSGDKEKPSAKTASRSARFPEFWAAYPCKEGKKPCEAKWKAKNLDRLADVILADIALRSEKHYRWLDGFIPNPLTYLNQERWNDAIMISPAKALSKEEVSNSGKDAAMRAIFGDDVDPAYYQGMSPKGQRTAANVMQWVAAKNAEL